MTGGRIAAEGRIADVYDVELQRETQARVLGVEAGYRDLHAFLSPPFVAFLYLPFSALSYARAAALWTALSIALLLASLAALRPLLPGLRAWPFSTIVLVGFASFPVLELLGSGQDSAVSLAILVGGLRLLAAGRDAAAGALLGFGVFKPQLVVLFPVLFAFERRWSAAASWIGVAAISTAASIALVGPAGAHAYLGLLGSDLYHHAIGEELRWKMLSLPALLGGISPPSAGRALAPIANASLAVAAVGFLFFVLRASHRSEPSRRSIALPYALTILVGACASPHFFVYDGTVLLLASLILLSSAPDERRLHGLLIVGFVLVWTAPMREVLFGALSWPLSLPAAPWAAIVVAVLAMEAARLSRGRAAES